MWAKKAIILFAVLLFSGNAFAVSFSVDARNLTRGTALADYPVTVQVLKGNEGRRTQQIKSVETRTNENGMAAGSIDAPPGSFIVAETTYRGVIYTSDHYPVGGQDANLSISLAAYEITDDRAEVRIPSRRVIILVKSDRMLEIFETLVVENTGKSAYVGKFNNELDMNQVLFIPMPKGYSLNGFSGYLRPRLRTSGRGIVTQNEVHPGTKEINMHYFVQSDIGMFDMTLYTEKDAPDIETMTIFFPSDQSWDMSSSGHQAAGNQLIGGKTYNVWKGRPADVTRIRVFGPGYSGGFSVWHAAIVLAFVVSGIFVFFSRGFISAWRLSREEKRLQELQGEIAAFTPVGSSGGQLRYFTDAINRRLEELGEEVPDSED